MKAVAQGESEEDIIKDLSFWLTVPHECGNCGSSDILPGHSSNKDKENFYFFKCQKCGYELKCGARKAGGLWVKNDQGWQKPWEPENQGGGDTSKAASQKQSMMDDDF